LAKRIAIALLVLPAAELIVFLLVVWAIGLWAALGLMILTSLAGGMLLRHACPPRRSEVRAAMARGRAPRPAARSGGLAVALGGILLLLPGFITDLLGAGLLIRPIRSRLTAAIGRAVGVPAAANRADAILDLTPDEWRALPDQPRPKG
jgi:UPF0716 protein FxsA